MEVKQIKPAANLRSNRVGYSLCIISKVDRRILLLLLNYYKHSIKFWNYQIYFSIFIKKIIIVFMINMYVRLRFPVLLITLIYYFTTQRTTTFRTPLVFLLALYNPVHKPPFPFTTAI
jgi:hypothetical protein